MYLWAAVVLLALTGCSRQVENRCDREEYDTTGVPVYRVVVYRCSLRDDMTSLLKTELDSIPSGYHFVEDVHAGTAHNLVFEKVN